MRKLDKRYKKNAPGFVRKTKNFFSNIFYFLKIGSIIILILLCARVYFGHRDKIFNNKITRAISSFVANHGFILDSTRLEGREHTSTEDIRVAIKIKKGDPIFNIGVNEIKQNLEKLEWVKTAVVYRELPSSMHIGIIERVPIGIGQYNKKLFLFDEEGQKINEKNLTPFFHLPIVVCEDPGLFVSDLYEIISMDKDLYNKVTSVVRVSERRWNIKLANEIEVKLPEYDIYEAWEKLIILNKNNELFGDNIISIDLRIPNKIFVGKK